MRISLPVLWRLSAGILVLLLFLFAAAPAFAEDTGTYKINDYIVTLEPQNDGRVLITIEQEWEVLSGGIPWVTVGLPNRNYELRGSSGDVSRVSDASGGGFIGVRVDLDRNYGPGETFTLQFTVLQGNLLDRQPSENKWVIDYTPGWYDRAVIERMRVNLVSPVSYQSYINIDPPPAVDGNVITWEATGLGEGERFDIRVESADGSFLTAPEPETESAGGGLGTGFWVLIGIIVVIGLFIVWRVRQSRKERDEYIKRTAAVIEKEATEDTEKKLALEEDFKEYVEEKGIKPDEQGRYYDRSYGYYMTPWIWAAIISSQNRPATPAGTAPPARPGCVACACVSCACACACACAGGGAAGCSRKTLHECRTCAVKSREEGEGHNV